MPPDQSIDPGLRFLVRFVHPEKLLPPLPGVTDRLAAQLFGLEPAQYDHIRADIEADAEGAAATLLAEPETAAALGRLKLPAGCTVVGLGDSLTDDASGWFEILKRAVTAHRPGDNISFVNAGVSGETTAQMLARMPAIAAVDPAWIICLAGTNNARRFGKMPAPQFSLSETMASLRALRDYAARETEARWLWLTPCGVDEALIDANWFWRQLQVRVANADVMAIADGMGAFAEPVIDLRRQFGSPVDPALLLDDGLHPNIKGQTAIARAVIGMLAAPAGQAAA